eukprot:TRINITY_DN9554_c0_g1_i15.p2 TRINITY_DN9554_c0_g1~~TRINITY_DN9554_c0_g1_i15.p2  ORF type:complete len:150 (-),score=36.43 TRINITY_DN9554_c0_g1_i15:119-568(-)
MAPNIYHYRTWQLLFSTSHDGVSYSTMFYKVGKSCPVYVLMEDAKGNVFGLYASQEIRDSSQFYGTGESFVFSFEGTLYVRKYKWSRANELFVYSDGRRLLAGGGNDSAIRIDEDFYAGHCGISETFNNELLSDEAFIVRNFEIWGIVD